MKTPYINLDDALKAALFDDEDAEERLRGQKAQRPRYVIGIDYRHGTLTVPIHDEAYGRLLLLLVAP